MKKYYFLLLPILINFFNAQSFILDQSFGTGGYTRYINESLSDVVMLPNGQFITASSTYNSIDLKKVNPDGTLNNVFGIKTIDIGNSSTAKDESLKKLILHNDKLFVIGRVNADPTYSQYNLFVGRVNLDGTMDQTYGNNGFAVFSAGQSLKVNDAVVDSNGNIYLHSNQGSSNYLTKITSGGLLDASFGTNGIILLTSSFTLYKMYMQNDGKIIFSGSRINTSTNLQESYIERRLSNGSYDTAFGNNGIVVVPNTSESAIKTFVYDYSNDSILILHQTYPFYSSMLFLSKIRISDGSFITSFGINGITIKSSYPNASHLYMTHMVVLPNSKIVATGSMNYSTNIIEQLFLTRFNANGTVDFSSNATGYQMFNTTPPNTSVRADYINNLFNLNNGSLIISYSGDSVTHGDSSYLTKINGAYLGVNDTAVDSGQNSLLYPNPVDNTFTVQNKNKGNDSLKYHIFDVSGKVVRNGSSNFNTQIHVQELQKGNYIIQIKTKDIRQSLKFIKK